MYTVGLIGDAQCPYHDPWAVSVAAQILADAKLDLLIYNGDWNDWRVLGKYPNLSPEGDSRFCADIAEERERSQSALKEFHKHVKPKKARWHDGNHEWRLTRSMEKDERALRVLGLKEVREAVSSRVLMGLDSLGIEYIGAYPKGSWAHPKLQPFENVWVEHGYVIRKHAGYACKALMEDRMSSVVINHVERLALHWKRALGRDYFGIENGNLSVIGEPDRGEGLYGGIPHSVPEYMSHRQGFSILRHDSNQWWPELVKIRDGMAVYAGKRYKA